MVVSWITTTWWANFFRNAGKCRDLRLLHLYFKRLGRTEEPHGLLWLGTCWGKPEHGPKCTFSPLGYTNPFAFLGGFSVSSLLPLTLNLLWACSFLFLGSRTYFLHQASNFCPQICTLTLPQWIFKWSMRNRISSLWSGCPYQQGGLDSEVLGTSSTKNLH